MWRPVFLPPRSGICEADWNSPTSRPNVLWGSEAPTVGRFFANSRDMIRLRGATKNQTWRHASSSVRGDPRRTVRAPIARRTDRSVEETRSHRRADQFCTANPEIHDPLAGTPKADTGIRYR